MVRKRTYAGNTAGSLSDAVTWLIDLEDMTTESDEWTVLFAGTLSGGVRPTSIISFKLDKVPDQDELAHITESAVQLDQGQPNRRDCRSVASRGGR